MTHKVVKNIFNFKKKNTKPKKKPMQTLKQTMLKKKKSTVFLHKLCKILQKKIPQTTATSTPALLLPSQDNTH